MLALSPTFHSKLLGGINQVCFYLHIQYLVRLGEKAASNHLLGRREERSREEEKEGGKEGGREGGRE